MRERERERDRDREREGKYLYCTQCTLPSYKLLARFMGPYFSEKFTSALKLNVTEVMVVVPFTSSRSPTSLTRRDRSTWI